MRVTENIHLIKDSLDEIYGEDEIPQFWILGEATMPLGENATGVYLLMGDKVALVDTGITDTPQSKVFPYLQKLGLKSSQISHAILTHGHGDHYQGTAALKGVSDVKIAIHELDASLIEVDLDGELFRRLHSMYPYAYKAVRVNLPALPKADILLKDGDELDLGGKTLEVIHTPGHTAGSISLYERDEDLLFTGDSIQGHFLHLYEDPDLYRESIRRLMKMDIDLMLMAHHYLPAKGPVVKGDEIKSFFEESLRTLKTCIETATEMLEEANRPLTLREVERALNVTTITAIKIIEKLKKDGKVEEVPPQPLYW